jgi:nucleolar complex protein 3
VRPFFTDKYSIYGPELSSGEALNIDLSEFVLSLYSLLMPLTLPDDIRVLSSALPSGKFSTTTIDLLFRALSLIFLPRALGSNNTGYTAGTTSGVPWRAAAFAKRLLSASLHWTSSTDILRAVDFVKTLVAKDPKLEAMLSTEDRIVNGVYRPDVDDPQLCQPFDTVFWELHVLHKRHWDPRVREQAEGLINFRPQ